ncbi:MAG: MBL fold metallo-hydrolase [Candidatus Hinthialibacter antarcticus]|nr:MBL fold metallo-hydrolase [Candidatus Hinthialibacter antarcticus]
MVYPHWRIIQIGSLSRNPYWGEDSAKRKPLCTITLLETADNIILIDPGFESPECTRTLLNRRSGLLPEQIDAVLLTHFHPTHYQELRAFPNATWLMPRLEIRAALNAPHPAPFVEQIEPFEDHSLPGVELLPAPGHTHGSSAYLFETRDGAVAVAGDAILTFDHFENRDPGDGCEGRPEARNSIDQIAKVADVIVPGHDNYFIL